VVVSIYIRNVRLLTAVLICLYGSTFAQVTLSSNALDFGDVLTTEEDEKGVDVTNTTSEVLSITDINIYNSAYSYTLANSTINPGSSQKIRVKFKPTQNVKHNSELIFVLSNGNEFRIDLNGNGKFVEAYYASTFDKSYQALKDELKSVISANYLNLGYSGARDKMYAELDNVNGTVTCVYTGETANFTTRSGANSAGFNCEHTWPQSLFSSNEPERADIHHLFPTDVDANSRRGNSPFGVVTNASWSVGGSKLGGGKFEPRDEQKGATARAMMYFAIRYGDYSNFIDGQESVLVGWHNTYAPTAAEKARNAGIFNYQKNRNPFVDHPEFMERIGKIGENDIAPIIKESSVAQSTINYGAVSLSDVRSIYIANTGNQDYADLTSITTSGKVTFNAVTNDNKKGESSKIEIGFRSDLADGSYLDTLKVDMQSQVGKTWLIPISFTIGASSTNEIKANTSKAFYNPKSKSIQIKNNSIPIQEVSIYNSYGQEVALNELNSSFTDIPFHAQAKGVYFVVVKTRFGEATSKILVY
jgi:endonuclease I